MVATQNPSTVTTTVSERAIAKGKIMAKYARVAKDTGSPEVQVALLTDRILGLAPHFEKNIHDHNGKRGMMKMIGQRRRLLRYLQKSSNARYLDLIKKLDLRK
jgi:small subunit ribosomal protein S15